jgi:hypothetical protein
MKKLNFVDAVAKNVKEGEEKQVDVAKKNAPILKVKFEAKVKVLEGQEMEAKSDLAQAEDALETAVGYNTADIEAWIRSKKVAEATVAEKAQALKNIQDSMEWHRDQIAIFELKK